MLREWTTGEMSLLVLLMFSLASGCICILEGGIPELPGADLKAEVEAPDKLFDGPLSPFQRLFVVSLRLTARMNRRTSLFEMHRRPRRQRSPRARFCSATLPRRLETESARRGKGGPLK